MNGTNLSVSWGDDKTVSPILSKDLKLSKKLARWWCQLKATAIGGGAVRKNLEVRVLIAITVFCL
jgi:hypothetical protein